MTAGSLLILSYLLMMMLQVVHIFEEIGSGAYKAVPIGTLQGPNGNGLHKFLAAASLLVTLNFVTFALILFGLKAGYLLGLATSVILAIGNGLVHTIGFLRSRSARDGLGAGVWTSIPLGIAGVLVFYQLARLLWLG